VIFLRSRENIPVLETQHKIEKVAQILTAMGKRDSPAQNPAAEFSASGLCLANLGTDYILDG